MTCLPTKLAACTMNSGQSTTPLLSRRGILKAAFAGAVAGIAAPLLSPLPVFSAQASGSKILIVFFSRSGNTRALAGYIQQQTGGDLLELQTAHPYPETYKALTEQAKREQQENFRPTLTQDVKDVQSYDLIFVGYPNWWGTMPMALFAFLEQHDVAGKKLAPFCTHEGSGFGRGPRDIAKLCPKATLLEGLAVRGSKAAEAQDTVAQWLHRIAL